MPQEIDQVQFGRFVEKVEQLEKSVEMLTESINSLNAKLNQSKGAWWVIGRIGGLAVLLIMALGWLWDHIPHR